MGPLCIAHAHSGSFDVSIEGILIVRERGVTNTDSLDVKYLASASS